MDRLSVLKETFDEGVLQRNAAIAALDSCREAVNEAKISLQLAQREADNALSADEATKTKKALSIELLNGSLDKSKILMDKVDRLTDEQIKTAETRSKASEILHQCKTRLADAERDFTVAERNLATLTDDCAKLSKEIERHTTQ